MILAISDIHIGYEKSNKDDLLRFMDEIKGEKIDHLILLGDIFDFWRRNSIKAIIENQEIFKEIYQLNVGDIHYIIGNHDYYFLEWYEKFADNYPFQVSKILRLEDGDDKFYFTHGYEMEVLVNYDLNLETYEKFCYDMCWNSDERGSFVSKLWKTVKSVSKEEVDDLKLKPSDRAEMENLHKFATSTAKNLFLGLETDETLIFGHTHIPFLEKDNKIANTGSWVDEYGKEIQNSYIIINEGEMELKFFK
ncbi:MAG: metallophosphoesterase family protein [Methanobacterium sp.]|nr:metallophosphoesterase family protein [Methanobacterium sp.]